MNLRNEAKDINDCLLTARIRVALVDEKERNNARNSIKFFHVTLGVATVQSTVRFRQLRVPTNTVEIELTGKSSVSSRLFGKMR